MRGVEPADRDRRLDVGGLADRERRPAHDPHEGRRVDDRDRDHRVGQVVAAQGDDRDRQQDRREGEDDVHQEDQDVVDPAAAVAGDHPEEHPDGAGDADGDGPDLERDPRPVEQPAEDVAAELVGAEADSSRSARGSGRHHLRGRIVRGHGRPDHGEDRERGTIKNPVSASRCRRMLARSWPGGAPWIGTASAAGATERTVVASALVAMDRLADGKRVRRPRAAVGAHAHAPSSSPRRRSRAHALRPYGRRCRSSRAGPQPRVEHGVEDVDRKADEDEDRRDDQRHALDDRVVAVGDRLEDVAADPRQAEDRAR